MDASTAQGRLHTGAEVVAARIAEAPLAPTDRSYADVDAAPRTGARIAVTARIARLDAWAAADVSSVRDLPDERVVGPAGTVTLPLVWTPGPTPSTSVTPSQ